MEHKEQGPRIPESVNGVQVNFCKNPRCANFGVPASTEKQPRGPGAAGKGRDPYIVKKKGEFRSPCMVCTHCKEEPPLKSNKAIDEETSRMLQYLGRNSASCPNSECANHTVNIVDGRGNYHSFGKTKSGSRRYRCKDCQTTFSIGLPTTRQRLPHKNIQVFRLLINKMPLKRICEAADISMPTLYDKTDFIRRQCLAFAANRERKLLEGMEIKRLYLCVDRQDYVVNWSQSEDKRNVILNAVGSADNSTGYVFGMHLNFDPSLNWSEVESDALKVGDYDKEYPFRNYARLWLQEDYEDALNRAGNKYPTLRGNTLDSEIESTYFEAGERADVEVVESADETIKLPIHGCQVHSEYTMYGHFLFLKRLLGGVQKIRFFMDQESSIRSACFAAFKDGIMQGTCDAFYVRINKGLTVGQRKMALSRSRTEWNALKRLHPDLKDYELKLMIIKDRIKNVKTFGKWQDRWVSHPFPNMSEPEKAVCYLTDTDKYDEDHMAWLYNKASLHAIDRFFMQARRRISLLERPISTPSSAGRRWHGYSPYDPGMVIKLLDIFRVFYNYVEIGKDKETPASRLGLAKGKVDMEDILYFINNL
jgi:transposase-like protein